MKEKLYAIVNGENVVVDAWVASSLEEAQADNPSKLVVEVTQENSPWHIGEQRKLGDTKNEKQDN